MATLRNVLALILLIPQGCSAGVAMVRTRGESKLGVTPNGAAMVRKGDSPPQDFTDSKGHVLMKVDGDGQVQTTRPLSKIIRSMVDESDEYEASLPNERSASSLSILAADKGPQRILDLARWANFDCQDKAGMLKGYESPTVLEVGSHDGEEIPAFKGIAKTMWSFEPSPDKVSTIQKTIKDNEMTDTVNFFNMAVSNETGNLKFWIDGENSQQNTVGHPPPWVTQQEFDEKAIAINVSTLDDIWEKQLNKAHITMLKMDTQGHEPFVLKGAAKLLAEDPPDIIHTEFSPKLMENAGVHGQEMLHVLYDAGYKCFDCAAFGPPELDASSRGIDEYEKHFGSFDFKGAQHGQWTDMVCLN